MRIQSSVPPDDLPQSPKLRFAQHALETVLAELEQLSAEDYRVHLIYEQIQSARNSVAFIRRARK